MLFTLSNCHAGIFSSFSHSFSTAAFCIRNFHRSRHKNKLVNQIVMGHRSISFACNVIFMIFRQWWFQTLSRGLMRFHDTCILCFWNLVGFTPSPSSFLRRARWALFWLCPFFLQGAFASDLARQPNFSMHVRSCASPALSGRASSAIMWSGTRCRSVCARTAKTGATQ